MKSQPSLIGSDRAIHLDAEAAVDLNDTLVVHPGHAEQDDPLGLDHPLDHPGSAVFGPSLQYELEGFHDLVYGLMELRLGRVLGLDVFYQSRDVVRHLFAYLAQDERPPEVGQAWLSKSATGFRLHLVPSFGFRTIPRRSWPFMMATAGPGKRMCLTLPRDDTSG